MHRPNAKPDTSRMSKRLAMLMSCALLSACVGSFSGGDANQGSTVDEASAEAAAPELTTPPTSSSVVVDAKVEIDDSCDSDAQCAIKDVGSCCGYRPACVNVDSPTDPAGVKAACEREGRLGVCGFPAISTCQCVNHRCEGITGPSSGGATLDDR